MALATPTMVIISTAGELVVIQVGNQEFSLEYETALRVSGDILLAARAAREADDGGKKNRTMGKITDAEAPRYKQGRWESLPPIVKYLQCAVGNIGLQVSVKISTLGFDMSYTAAFKIAQWLRINGKEARNFAGASKTHWTEIARIA